MYYFSLSTIECVHLYHVMSGESASSDFSMSNLKSSSSQRDQIQQVLLSSKIHETMNIWYLYHIIHANLIFKVRSSISDEYLSYFLSIQLKYILNYQNNDNFRKGEST